MLIVIFIIGVALFVIGLNIDSIELAMASFVGSAAILFIMALMIFFFPYRVDEKIELYETENEKIEAKIKENSKDIKPLGRFTVNNVGALEIAYMIEVLEQSICTLRQQDPKVEEAEKMLKKEFKIKNKTIYTEEKD